MESNVKNHYNSDNLTQNIRSALIKAGKSLSQLTLKDLSRIDQLHTGGARASIELFEKLNFPPAALILDAGCGIGGSSRLLAQHFGCRVIGIDLADKFIDAAVFLTQCTGFEDKVSFQQGSVLELPFDDNTFDAVLCQHILMNIKDKSIAVNEFSRVLKKGGMLMLHEITKGPNDTLLFPVPWAGDPSISFIEPWEIMADVFRRQGFETVLFSDQSRLAGQLWEKVRIFNQKQPPDPDSLGAGLIFGENAAAFGRTMHENFSHNSICLVEAVLKK